ncbi:ABC transporter permease [Saccharolobus islandicus]|jgi:ABC-type transport system, involved in lipoprotein release, permease component|uniref:ABC transporter permease n=1 Tax=Saccharolobus islandicus TaxID=43080 RepID=UPI00241E3525|nr:ABC transporter permease [Sulfolobus islandicus]
MNLFDILWLSYKGLISRKIIVILAIISVVIGVASVTTLVAFTQGVDQSILSVVESLGPKTILILPSRGSLLTQATVATIESLPGVEAVYGVVSGFGTINVEGQPIDVTIIGVNNLSAILGQVLLESGSTYPPITSPEAVIGSEVANPVPGVYFSVGSEITIQIPRGNSVNLEVVGILSPSGANPLSNSETSIFIPLGEAMAILNKTSYNELIVEAQSVNDVNTIATIIEDIYGNQLNVVTVQQLINTVSTITSGFSFLLITVASISLFVGAVGIMAIMLSRVYQRIREIGIMKTLGLTTRDVLLVFMSEAGIIGVIGGLIGIVAGLISTSFVDILSSISSQSSNNISESGFRGNFAAFSGGSATGQLLSFKPIISVEAIVIALIVAIAVSLIAGLYPAWKASKLTVIDAIRRE